MSKWSIKNAKEESSTTFVKFPVKPNVDNVKFKKFEYVKGEYDGNEYEAVKFIFQRKDGDSIATINKLLYKPTLESLQSRSDNPEEAFQDAMNNFYGHIFHILYLFESSNQKIKDSIEDADSFKEFIDNLNKFIEEKESPKIYLKVLINSKGYPEIPRFKPYVKKMYDKDNNLIEPSFTYTDWEKNYIKTNKEAIAMANELKEEILEATNELSEEVSTDDTSLDDLPFIEDDSEDEMF